jgi:hypothetical protein
MEVFGTQGWRGGVDDSVDDVWIELRTGCGWSSGGDCGNSGDSFMGNMTCISSGPRTNKKLAVEHRSRCSLRPNPDGMLIPQVRPARKILHLPLGDDSSPSGDNTLGR